MDDHSFMALITAHLAAVLDAEDHKQQIKISN